jgi:tagatose-6-phosphate ketose/aldose isomerase
LPRERIKKVNALASLLNLPESERANRGLTHTPREIAQQPDTWLSTFEIFKNVLPDITTFLASMGTPLTIFLIGAGTSDYIGRSLTHLFRCLWGFPVRIFSPIWMSGLFRAANTFG